MEKMRKAPIIILSVVGALVLGLVLYLLIPSYGDYGSFAEIRDRTVKMFIEYGCVEKDITGEFSDYKINLNPLTAFVFKSWDLGLFLKSYSSGRIDTASVSQFEVGSGGDKYFDITFMVRPKAAYSAPFFLGDALHAIPGAKGAMYMDFYSLDDGVDLDAFFGSRKKKLQEALELAKPYWNTQRFGALTKFLDPFKSPFRIEILEPQGGTEEEVKAYFETVSRCSELFFEAYMESLVLVEPLDDLDSVNIAKINMKNYVANLYEHDIAVQLGKMMFPEEDFDRYFLDGFWGLNHKTGAGAE